MMARATNSFSLAIRPFSNSSVLCSRSSFAGWQLWATRSARFSTSERLPVRNLHTIKAAPQTRMAYRRPSYQSRLYYTAGSPPEAPYPPTETAILNAATAHIPLHGFTAHTLTLGAIDAGYLPASVNLFPHGPFDLVSFHLATCRLALKDSVQFPDQSTSEDAKALSTAEKVRSLLIARLRANEAIIHKLPEALGLMSLPTNVPSSLRELAFLVDEILYLAGDTDVSASWYTKRAALSGVYASSELFMTQDQSKDFEETERFVDRRLEDSENAAYAAGAVAQWLGFTGLSAINVLRSWGAKI